MALLKRIRSRKLLYWILGGGIGFIVLSVVSVEVTSQSWFCNSCHIMNPYYASWQNSAHADVKCVECHIEPGVDNFLHAKLNGLGQVVDDVLNRTSTKPSASVSLFSCTRSGCHNFERMKEQGRQEQPFFYQHGKHLELDYLGVKIQCTTCHSHIKGDKHFEINTNACVTCHLIETEPGQEIMPTNAVLASHDSEAKTGKNTDTDDLIIISRFEVRRPQIELAPDLLTSEEGATLQPSSVRTETPDTESEKAHNTNAAGEISPPFRCQNCHEPPREVFQYRGLEIDHNKFLSFGAACESCHRNMTAKPFPVEDSQCYSCHVFGMERMTNATDMHKVHTEGESKVECFSCHGVTRHGPEAQAMQMDQLDCRSCHKGQHNIQQETYLFAAAAEEEPHMPEEGAPAVTPMLLVHVDCTGCHNQETQLTGEGAMGSTVARATPQSCDACHQKGLGEKMVPLWQSSTHELYDSVLAMLPEGGDLSNITNPRAKRILEQAQKILRIVELDGSWGVHNPRYTEDLLDQARRMIEEGQRIEAISKGAGG